MTPEQIAEARRLCDRATPGPWYSAGPLSEEESCIVGGMPCDVVSEDDISVIENMSPRDQEFIAAARKLLPAALAHIETLEKALAVQPAENPNLGDPL